MKNTELTKIREDKKLSKKEFAELLGITPMLLGRYEKGTCAIPDSIAEKLAAASDKVAAEKIEVKKNTRKAARTVKEAAEDAAAVSKEALKDKIAAEEIEVKKAARKAGRKAKEKAAKVTSDVKKKVKKAAGLPNIVIQSPMGGYISLDDIAKKVPKKAADIYVRVDENKLYYVLENGKTGDVDIWD